MSVVASTLLALWVTAGPSSDGLLSDPEAQKHFKAAQAAFNDGNYEVASKELEKAFLIEPADALLYPWAQAERFSGHCKVAIDLYEKFLATEPSDNFRVAAEENLERCQEEIDQANAAVAAQEESDEDTKVEPLDDGGDEVAKHEPEPRDTKPDRSKKKDRKWYHDPVGGVLTGLGVAGVAAGGALLGVSASRAGDVGTEDTNQDYLDARRSATTLRNAGAGVLSVGGALLIAGIVRYALLATKGKRSGNRASKGKAQATLGPWFSGRTSGGVTFQTRF